MSGFAEALFVWAGWSEVTGAESMAILPVDRLARARPLTTGRPARYLVVPCSNGGNGVIYPSPRYPTGPAVGLFWPDCVTLPVIEARHLRYTWNSQRVTRYFVHGTEA